MVGRQVGLIATTLGKRPCEIAEFEGSPAEKLFFDIAVLAAAQKPKSVRDKIEAGEYG